MELKYKYLIGYSMIIILLLIIWVLPKLNDNNDIIKNINKKEKTLHSIIFLILSFIIISNVYIYPTKDVQNSLIHENIYVYYFIIIFIIFNILHELLKFERYLKN